MKKVLLFVIVVILITASQAIAQYKYRGSGNGVITSTDCSTYTAIGQLCQDTDDGILYKGTGSAVEEVGAGNVTIITQSATGNITEAQMKGQTHVVTGAYTLSLPTAVVGYRARFIASTAAAFSIDVVTGTDVIVLNGTALTAGNKATTDGTINAEVYVECRVAGKYHIISIIGLAVDGGA